MGTRRHTTSAKANNPRLPMAAPVASIPAAFRPRTAPCKPARSFFCRSCFSIKVMLAGRIAGNARNNPPIPGPNFFAIMPVSAVTIPPAKNRMAYSWNFVFFSTAGFSETLIVGYRRTANHSPKATANHSSSETLPANFAGHFLRIISPLTAEAYTRNAAAPSVIEHASVEA